jgi:hypothetical protein
LFVFFFLLSSYPLTTYLSTTFNVV